MKSAPSRAHTRYSMQGCAQIRSFTQERPLFYAGCVWIRMHICIKKCRFSNTFSNEICAQSRAYPLFHAGVRKSAISSRGVRYSEGIWKATNFFCKMCTRIRAHLYVEYRTPLLEIVDLCAPLREMAGSARLRAHFIWDAIWKATNFLYKNVHADSWAPLRRIADTPASNSGFERIPA